MPGQWIREPSSSRCWGPVSVLDCRVVPSRAKSDEGLSCRRSVVSLAGRGYAYRAVAHRFGDRRGSRRTALPLASAMTMVSVSVERSTLPSVVRGISSTLSHSRGVL